MPTGRSPFTVAAQKLNISPEQYIDFALHPKKNAAMVGAELIVRGDVDLSLTKDGKKVKNLPAADIHGSLRADEECSLKSVGSVTVRGRTVVSGSKVAVFAPNFRAVGDFEAIDCGSLTHISGRYEGNVNLTESSILGLGNDFYCGGDLSVERCPNARVIDCRVKGDFSAWESGVCKLGKNFSVSGDAKFFKCDGLSSIGDIGNPKDVLVRGGGIEIIDKGFRCRGALVLNRCSRLHEISRDIDCGSLELTLLPVRELKIDKELNQCQVERCRRLESITVKCRDVFDMSGCSPLNFERVGRGVKLLKINECGSQLDLGGNWGGDVILSNSDGPAGILSSFSCKGNLSIYRCRGISRIEGSVGGNLDIEEVASLRELSAGLKIKGDLNLLTFPSSQNITLGCQVGGNLDGNGYMKTNKGVTDGRSCAVERTTDSFWVGGNVDLAQARRLKYMRGFVGGSLNLDSSAISVLGKDLEVKGNVSAKGCDSLSRVDCLVGGSIDTSGRLLSRLSFDRRRKVVPSDSKGLSAGMAKSGAAKRSSTLGEIEH